MGTFPPDLRTRAFQARPAPYVDPHLRVDDVARVSRTGEQLSFETADGTVLDVRLRLVGTHTLRLTVADGGDAVPGRSAMLVDFDESPARLTDTDEGFAISGLDDSVTITHDGRLVLGSTGAVLRLSRTHRATSSSGESITSGSSDVDRSNPWLDLAKDDGADTRSTPGDGTVVQPGWMISGAVSPLAQVFGTGESFHGPQLRGRLVRLVNLETDGVGGLDNSYLNVPFVWTDDGWGAFVHTGEPLLADLAHTHGETVVLHGEMPSLDLFVFIGPGARVLSGYHAVTGLPGPFPDWGLGVWTSRCSYLSAAEAQAVVADYRDARCPIDVLHVDAWGEGNLMRELTTAWRVDRARWPDGWSESLHEAGVRVSLWHNPYLLEGSAVAQEAVAAGHVVVDAQGASVPTNDRSDRLLVDFTSPAARAWWQSKVRELVESEGADAMKADFAEEVPPHALFADGRTGWELRNEYGLLYQQATHEALESATGPGAALFSRSGTAGAQRYPCHWVGDSPATWDGLTSALRACLSLSMSGFAFVASDIGGFWTDQGFADGFTAFDQDDPSSFRPDVEPELFVRWTQFGTLSPVMRFHGLGRREPHAYPEPYRSMAIAACQLRGMLRPNLEAAAREASLHGTPMMRPMQLAFPDDIEAGFAALQYMLGPDVLCAPVTRPDGRVRLYVPHGSWAPLQGVGSALTGPGWVDLELPLDRVPAWRRRR